MSFRIERYIRSDTAVLRIEGQLVGKETWGVLSDQIVRVVAEYGRVVLDVERVTAYDDACLAAIEAGLGSWLSLEGTTAYLEALLERRRGRKL